MSSFMSALKDILTTLTLAPASKPLLAITIAMALTAAWFGFKKTAEALKFPMNSGFRPLASLTLLIVLCLVSAAAAAAYICPRVSLQTLSRFLPLITAVLALLAIVVPISCLLMKSKYLQTLSSFLVPVIAAAIVVFLAKGIAGAISEGEKGFSTTKERTEGMNELLPK